MNGKIKWYNKDKQYGFIVGNDGKDYYFNQYAIKKSNITEDTVNKKLTSPLEFFVEEGKDRVSTLKFID